MAALNVRPMRAAADLTVMMGAPGRRATEGRWPSLPGRSRALPATHPGASVIVPQSWLHRPPHARRRQRIAPPTGRSRHERLSMMPGRGTWLLATRRRNRWPRSLAPARWAAGCALPDHACGGRSESERGPSGRCRRRMGGWSRTAHVRWLPARRQGVSRRYRSGRGLRGDRARTLVAAGRTRPSRGCSHCRRSSSVRSGCDPAWVSSRVPVRSRRWKFSRRSTVIGSPGAMLLMAEAIASMLPSTSVAVTSAGCSPSSRAASALRRRRAPTSKPSMREEATHSARRRMRASASVSTSVEAWVSSTAMARSASATSAAVSPLSASVRPTRGSGTYAS